MSRIPAKDRKLLERICDKQLTHLPRPRVVSVVETCRSIEEARIQGSFLQAGCGLGGLAILISTAKYPVRPFRIYDDFAMAPYEEVLNNLKAFGIDLRSKAVSIFKGQLRESMRIRGDVAFAHVDVEQYDPVMTCLSRIIPKLSSGGSIILEAYHDQDECRKAADECLKGIEGQFTFDDSAGSMRLTKIDR